MSKGKQAARPVMGDAKKRSVVEGGNAVEKSGNGIEEEHDELMVSKW